MRRFVSTAVIAIAALILVAINAGAQLPGGSPDAAKVKNPVASNAASVTAGAKFTAAVPDEQRMATGVFAFAMPRAK